MGHDHSCAKTTTRARCIDKEDGIRYNHDIRLSKNRSRKQKEKIDGGFTFCNKIA